MTSIFPPILENRAPAIDFVGSKDDAATKTLDIHFMMPNLNGIGSQREIKNAQVVVRYKSNNQIAISPAYLPDRATLFYNIEEESDYWSEDQVTGLCTLKVPYACFIGGFPAYNTEYYVQVRFGDTKLWGEPSLGLWYSNLREFSAWHSIQVNSVPSHFGEWSNISTVYCTRRATTDLSVNLDDYVPELVWEYRPSSGAVDNLEQIQVQWEWDQDDKISQTKHYIQSQVFTGARNGNGNFTFRTKIPIAPVRTITFFVNAVTSHNVIYNDRAVLVCNPLNLPIQQGVDCYIKTKELSREENNDGIIAKEFYFNSPNSGANYINLYRYNLNTLECVRIKAGLPANMFEHYVVKDFTVEMGEEYQYVACLVNQYNKVFKVFEKMGVDGEGTGGYARLMSMEVSFLTTRYHQLRLHGGVSISSFKRNVSESFQTTIGSKFPYYSKNSNQNYRSFSLSATISINFDPTFAFIRLREGIGATWEDKDSSKYLFGEKDIYGDEQFSLSRYRSGYEDKVNQHPEMKQLQQDNEGDLFGPKTIYSPFLYKRTTTNVGTSQQNETIFLERKFREMVMSWLSDGKPKLYRSETEGNMIVILTGVSFTPVQKTQRLIYSMSCTVTEIAEYNLENLIEYDLIPSEIISEYKPTGEWDFQAGNYDPMLDHKMKFNVLKSFRIPDTLVGTQISEIDLSQGIVNGVAPFTFTGGVGVGSFIIPGVQLLKDGTVFGKPTQVSEPTQVLISVKDSAEEPTEITFPLNIGRIYPTLEIKTTNADGVPIKIDGLTVGEQITPINIGLSPLSVGQAPYTWYANDLPPGLMMKMVGTENQEVIISGTFVYEIQEGAFTLIVEDAYGQVATAQIPYGSSLSELRYLYDSAWDKLEEMEEGTALPSPMKFGNSVIGGIKPYTFEMSPIPKGLTFNSATGELSGTPSGDTYPAHSYKATLTVTDNTGRSDSVEVIIPTIYARFEFDTNDKLTKYFLAQDRTYFATGTLFNDLDIMEEVTPGDNPKPLVRGGKKNSEVGLPPYMFDCIADTGGILENFGISNAGVIHGYTVSSHPAGKITIRATDARNVTISRTFNVSETKGNFTIIRQSEWEIKTMPVTSKEPPTRWLKIYPEPPGFVNNGGSWDDYVVTYSDFPPGMQVMKAVETGRPVIIITGQLTGEYNKGRGVINVTDGNGDQASLTIPIGDIYSAVQWKDDVIPIEEKVVNTRLGQAYTLPQIQGGLPPYTIFIDDGPPLSPLFLNKTTGITASDVIQVIDGDDGVGPTPRPARQTVLKVKDSRNTTSAESVVIDIGEVHPAFAVEAVPIPATYFIKDVTEFKDNDFRIANITGGSGQFTFYYNGLTNQILPNGLTLTADGYLRGKTLVLQDEDMILSGLTVKDNVSLESKPLNNFVLIKTIPKPDLHPDVKTALNGNGEYVISGLALKVDYKSPSPLFNIAVSGATLSTRDVPQMLTVNAQYYLVGPPQQTKDTQTHCTVTATLAGNRFTAAQSITAKLLLEPITGVLNFKWVPLDAGNQGGIPVNKPFSLTISDGASGGKEPYSWTLVDAPTGTGLTLQVKPDGTAVIAGTPTVKKNEPFTFRIKLTDANGATTPIITLNFAGIYDELKINTTGLSIGPADGGAPIDAEINLAEKTSGGIPNTYRYSSEDLGQWGYSLTPEGRIFGNASVYSVEEGDAHFVVTDDSKQRVEFTIHIKAITGQMGLKQTEYNVPAPSVRGAPFPTIRMKNFIIEGTGDPKAYSTSEDIPLGWLKEGSYGIELTEDGEIKGTYPNQQINTEMKFVVRIADTDGISQIVTINLPKIN